MEVKFLRLRKDVFEMRRSREEESRRRVESDDMIEMEKIRGFFIVQRPRIHDDAKLRWADVLDDD